MRTIGRHLLLAIAMATAFAMSAAAQSPPPVRGTMALEGNVKAIYAAARTVIVATVDGVDHVYHFTANLIVHGGRKPGPDALRDWKEGTTVVVHYSSGPGGESAEEIDRVGDQGLLTSEGMITDINRRKQQLTVRFDNGKVETYHLTARAAAESAANLPADLSSARVVIYYTNEAGERVTHYFRLAKTSTPRRPAKSK